MLEIFRKKKSVSNKQNLMSPFDAYALDEILRKFNRTDLTCMEIGSWYGSGSTQIIAKYSEKLICVDHWKGNENDEMKRITKSFDVFSEFLTNTSHLGNKIIPFRGMSDGILKLLKNQTFDFIFIDGDHRYSTTVGDITACNKLVKNGGILAGHDCEGKVTSENKEILHLNRENDHIDSVFIDFLHCHPGVILAVDELLEEVNLYADQKLDLGDKVGYSTIWWAQF